MIVRYKIELTIEDDAHRTAETRQVDLYCRVESYLKVTAMGGALCGILVGAIEHGRTMQDPEIHGVLGDAVKIFSRKGTT